METGKSTWKANIIPVYKKGTKEDPGNCRLVSLTSVPRKVMKWLNLEITCRHMKKKIIWSSQHGFTKGKSCLINRISFCNEMTALVGGG